MPDKETTDDAGKVQKVEPLVVTNVVKEIPTPRFDVKITLTTRGWTWEIEVKDCPDGTLAQHLAAQAREVIAVQMKDILAEQSEKSGEVKF